MNPRPAPFVNRSETLANRFLLSHLPTPPTQRRVNGVGKPKGWAKSKSEIKGTGRGLGRLGGYLLNYLKTKTGTGAS
jgi:hypothetical protein